MKKGHDTHIDDAMQKEIDAMEKETEMAMEVDAMEKEIEMANKHIKELNLLSGWRNAKEDHHPKPKCNPIILSIGENMEQLLPNLLVGAISCKQFGYTEYSPSL